MDSSLQKDQDDLQRAKNGKRILVVDDVKPTRDIIKYSYRETIGIVFHSGHLMLVMV